MLGAWDIDAYVVRARDKVSAGVYAHRFRVNSARELECTGSMSYTDATSQWASMCRLERVGP
jgi:hypothetical protein